MTRKTPAKIFVFLFMISAIVLSTQKLSLETPNPGVESLTTLSTNDTSIFFIGSSRVQKGIDPNIVGDSATTRVFNLGISGSSFLSNCVVADFIIRQPGYKELYIELTPLLEELPEGLFDLASQLKESPSRTVLTLTESRPLPEQSMMMISIINQQLFRSITIGDDIRKLLGYQSNTITKSIGFDPYDKNNSRDVTSFLTWEEINVLPTISIDLTKYNVMIEHLNKVARDNNSRIVFFLPITCSNTVEKDIIIPLYRALPDLMKLNYSDNALNQMRRPAYLGDPNHLNRKGATEYSMLIRDLLDK